VSDIAISFAILGAIVVLLMSNRVPVGIVAIGAALSLWATGVLELEQVLAGFGDPTVLFIASLFVVSEGLDATGVTAWAGQQLIDRAGEGRTRLIVLMMLLVAGLTALISVNGAVAALLPVVVVMAVRLGRSPSQLLMPLVFGAHAGSLLALTGTPVHVLVSDAAVPRARGAFGYFEFALAGIPMLVGSIAIVVLFGERLLPDRRRKEHPCRPQPARTHAHRAVPLEDGAFHLRVRENSPLVWHACHRREPVRLPRGEARRHADEAGRRARGHALARRGRSTARPRHSRGGRQSSQDDLVLGIGPGSRST
jgi:Na+/H+ antiporter NhaD/arsenite permease-like protein